MSKVFQLARVRASWNESPEMLLVFVAVVIDADEWLCGGLELLILCPGIKISSLNHLFQLTLSGTPIRPGFLSLEPADALALVRVELGHEISLRANGQS